MTDRSKIFVAGHRGLVGSAIARRLAKGDYQNVVTCSRDEVDLCDESAVRRFFAEERPNQVVLAAAKVGGILANDRFPGDFIRENLKIQLNVIDACREYGAAKLLFLGSSCIYPKHAPQPMKEDCLLTGPLESTNSAYAIAKIAGIEMCHAYARQYGLKSICVMPTNLYGPGDNFDLESSHVLPALIRKFHEAKQVGAPTVTLWGTGKPRREFLHVDDLADACVFLLETVDEEPLVNVGCGQDISIAELAALIADIVGYRGDVIYDSSKPDGTPRKLLDVTRLNERGWSARVDLRSGIAETYEWYRDHA